MKRIKVTSAAFKVVVITDDENTVQYNVPKLKLKRGDDLGEFYKKNKNRYNFKKLKEDEKSGTVNEKYQILAKKNPVLDKFKKDLDLEIE